MERIIKNCGIIKANKFSKKMKNGRECLSPELQLIKISRTIKLAISVSIFLTAIFSAVFLFSNYTSAQNIRQFAAPSFACQFYRSQQGFTIVRNLEHDCLVRNGSNGAFVYTHFYDSGNNFCVEVTSSFGGRIVAPQCVPISQTGRLERQQQQNRQSDKPKIITPPAFQIRELQYDTLPTGRQIQAGDNERIEITMPDGSLIQLDAKATFTPVSDHEVQSVFGRYRYLWQPFHDGKCIVGQNLVRQDCRRVRTPNALLGDRGTEFLVESGKAGTTVTVLDGVVIATDLAGKKTIEIVAGQSTFIKKGGLPEEPQAYDPAKLDRWWEKKTTDENVKIFVGIMFGIIIFVVIISALVAIVKKIFGKKKPAPAAVPVMTEKIPETPAIEKSVGEEKKKKGRSCALAALGFILGLGLIIATYFIGKSQT